MSKRQGLYLDTGEWEYELSRLRKHVKGKAGKLMTDEAKLLVADLIKLTPPTDGRHPLTTNLKQHEVAGQKAILTDLRKVIKDVTQLDMYKNPRIKNWLNKAFKNHDWALVMDIINDHSGNAGMQVPTGWHEESRNRRGRVKSGPRFYVKDTKKEAKLMAYAKGVFKRMGKAKAGWLPAARKLKLAQRHYIGFIKRHRGRGLIRMKTKNTYDPVIYIANLVSYIQKAGREQRIMAVALRHRADNIRLKIEKMVKDAAIPWIQTK